MRIAIDIDSTLHHLWDQLEPIAERRFGMRLDYEEQTTYGFASLDHDQAWACVQELQSDAAIAAAVPYPDAVETVRAWHAMGHFIQITSHRADATRRATAAWLDAIGLPYDELYLSFDKVTYCRTSRIELLIDDAPGNLEGAIAAGIAVATIDQPWNRQLCAERGLLCAPDWRTLRAGLADLLGDTDAPPALPSVDDGPANVLADAG